MLDHAQGPAPVDYSDHQEISASDPPQDQCSNRQTGHPLSRWPAGSDAFSRVPTGAPVGGVLTAGGGGGGLLPVGWPFHELVVESEAGPALSRAHRPDRSSVAAGNRVV